MRSLIFVVGILISYSFFAHSQGIESAGGPYPPLSLSRTDSVFLSLIPPLTIPELYQGANAPALPGALDNSIHPYFRGVFQQEQYSCGQASSVGYAFTYEINRSRNLPANVDENRYPTHFAWNWMNGGNGWYGASYYHTFQLLRRVGTPTVETYGGMAAGGPTLWMNGYDNYYAAMQNRIHNAYAINTSTPEGITYLKHWLHDHMEGAEIGGVANFYANHPQLFSLPAGTPHAGKKVAIAFSSSSHAMTIIGYNDSICWDYNGDGLYTNHLDITGDGVVDVKDWEIGGFRMVNSYGGVPNWGDQGFCYMMYRSLAMPYGQGGIWNNTVNVLDVKPVNNPLLTFKVAVKHTRRDRVRISAGVSQNPTALEPEIEITFPIVDYQGGNFYMQGGTTEEAKTLEFGLDVSELLNQITPGSPARFFFSVIEDDPNNSFQGEIVSFSVMDYTAGLTEISSGFSQVPLENNDKTTVFCNATVTYTPVAITTTALDPVNAALPYSCTLQAEGGDTPYRWSKYYPYAMEQTANALPMTTAEPLSITNHNSGYATKTLEFPFPFFNNTYQTLYISANGFIFFDLQNYPWPYTHDNKMVFRGYRKIAPLDADLTTQGGGIWYEGNSEYALFRWEAFSENADLLSDYNFGVKLYPNGDIEFLYGDNSTLSTMEWYSGISDGDYINFLFSGVFDEEEIPQNSGLFFTAPDFLPQLSISSEGIVTGIIDNDQDGVHLYAAVTDNNRIQDRKSFPVTVQGLQMQTFPQTQNDSIIEFGEQVFLDVIIDNLGDFTYHNSFMTIHTDDSLVILTDSTESLGVLLAQGTTMIPNAFVFEVDTHIPDGHPIDFYGEITSDYAPYPFEFSHIAYAPVIHIQTTCFVTDNNEILPGDTAVMEIRVENSGGSGLTSLVSQLTNTDPYITFTPIIGQLPELEHYSTDTLKYSVIVRGDAHPGHLDFSLLTLTSAEEISLTDSLFFNVGGIMEGFESGDLNFLPWQTAGDQGWLVQEATSWQGDFSARNKAITDNQQSELFLEMNILTGGYLRFARKVSSENNYDYLRFFGNGQEMDKWAGEKNWEVVSYPISKGPQVFRWRYTKDHSVSTGQDCGWIDNLSFPACQLVDDVVNAGLNLMICEGDNAQLTGTAVNCAYVEWSTSGDGFFTVTDDVNTTYTPGNQDIQMQGATLTLTSYNAFGESLSDFVLMGIHPRPEVTAGTDTAICTSGTYTITEAEVNNTTSVAWSSSGDGLFDAYQSLQPTYYPGEGDYTAGQVILTLTAMGNSACNHTESDSFTLSFLPLPEADAGEDITIPFGAFTTLQGSVSGGSGPWLWHWSPEEIFVDPLVQNPETVNLEASVIISLVVTDSITGCTGMDEMIITVTGGALNVLVTLTPEEVCLGGPIQLMALPGGGSGDYSFEWSSIPPGFYSTDPAPIDTPLVTTTYSIQLSDGFNTIENSATAQVYPLPEPDLGNDQVVCAYHSTLLTPGIFESYLWSTGATTPSIEVDSTGIGMNTQEFWVRVENEHGCFKSDTVAVTFDPCTGIAPSTNTTLRIYPVPAHNKLWIETTKVPSDATIMIHDLTGRMLVKKIQKEKVSRIALDISALQAGYYLITVKTGNKRMTGKFTIIK